MKKALLLGYLLFISQFVFAAHIIGGSISYESLDSNNYLVKVEILRDCASGGAGFDQFINLSVFNDNNDFVGVHEIEADTVFTIYSSFDSTSVQCNIPTSLCVEKAIYTTEINFEDTSEFYTLTYERCCLTSLLVNLVDPSFEGMTFTTVIPIDVENSSPVFYSDFPLGIGVNIPFMYDGSAYDIDGDSLVYQLQYPFRSDSAGQFSPSVIISAPPPYSPIEFNTGYPEDNMLGSNYALNIDQNTGLMLALADVQGYFLIGYYVEEYRNDQLISTTYRTFVFGVGIADESTNYDISGQVMVEDTVPIDEGTVLLLELDLLSDSLLVYQEQLVDENANYNFENIPPGIFLLRAFVNEGSQYYEEYVPTYSDSSLVWYGAMGINQCDSSEESRNINLIHIDDTNGDISFDGYVFDSFFGIDIMDVDLDDMTLYLLNDEGLPVGSSGVNTEGYFEINNLSPGSYTLLIDLFNYRFDESIAPLIELDTDRRANITIYPGYVEVDFSLGVDNKKINPINIYPNPTQGRIYFTDKENSIKSIKLFSVDGKVVFEKIRGDFSNFITIDGDPGIYLLQVNSDNESSTFKIIKH